MHCLYCGSNIPQDAQFCEACGRRQNPVVLPQPNAQPATSGQIKTLWPLVVFAIAALLLFIVFNIIPALLMVGLLFSWMFILPRSSMARRQKLIWTFATLGLAVGIQVYQVHWQPEMEKSNPEQPAGQQPAAAATKSDTNDTFGQTSSPQQRAAQQKFMFDLQHKYEQNGYDIDVRVNPLMNTLNLTSDLFRDGATRDEIVGSLVSISPQLCSMAVWYAKVGYSKGMLSSDVAKTVSFNCPAAKAERIKQTTSAREELAAQLNDADGRMHVRTDGTTLVLESPLFLDTANFRAALNMLMEQKQDLCDRGFSRVQLKGKNQTKTFPIRCN